MRRRQSESDADDDLDFVKTEIPRFLRFTIYADLFFLLEMRKCEEDETMLYL